MKKIKAVLIFGILTFQVLYSAESLPLVITPDDLLVERDEGIVLDLRDLLVMLKNPGSLHDYALVRIVHNPIPGPLVSNGNIEVLNPVNVGQTIKTVTLAIPLDGLRGNTLVYHNGVPPTYALCQISPSQLNTTGILIKLPTSTLMVPDNWVSEIGKLLTVPDVAGFTAVPKEVPVDLHFASNLTLMLYAEELSKTDFKKFRDEYPKLMNHSDLYTGAFVTDLLLQRAAGNQNILRDGSPGSRIVDSTPAATETQVAVWSELQNYVESIGATPQSLGGVALGIRRNLVELPLPQRDEYRNVILLIKGKLMPGNVEWAETNRIINMFRFELDWNLFPDSSDSKK